MSADGRTLHVATSGDGSSISAIDVRAFGVVARWSVEGDVTGLGLSTDGTRLYLATTDGLKVLDVRTGSELAEVALRSPEPVTKVIAIAS